MTRIATDLNQRKSVLSVFYLFLLLQTISLKAEQPDSTLKKIKLLKTQIKSAADIFKINPIYLSAIIYIERTLNYDWEDDALDELLAKAGLNSSIGFCQIKIKTAYWIETQLYDSNSIYFLGKRFKKILFINSSTEELISKLINDSLNILYAAAYIKIIQSRWEKTGCSINDKPEIIGTLFSTGLFNINGTERKPNKYPKPNSFGEKVRKSISLFH